MEQQRIVLAREDQREGLRLLRAQKMARDAQHMADNEYQIWMAQVGAMYGVPDGWGMRDIIEGFAPMEAEHGG